MCTQGSADSIKNRKNSQIIFVRMCEALDIRFSSVSFAGTCDHIFKTISDLEADSVYKFLRKNKNIFVSSFLNFISGHTDIEKNDIIRRNDYYQQMIDCAIIFVARAKRKGR